MKNAVPPKRRFAQDLHGATSHRTALFIVTAVEISNLTEFHIFLNWEFVFEFVSILQFWTNCNKNTEHFTSVSVRHVERTSLNIYRSEKVAEKNERRVLNSA
jgi:hypothetical protein